MNTFAIGSLPVHFSVAKLFTFRWQYTLSELNDSSCAHMGKENYLKHRKRD